MRAGAAAALRARPSGVPRSAPSGLTAVSPRLWLQRLARRAPRSVAWPEPLRHLHSGRVLWAEDSEDEAPGGSALASDGSDVGADADVGVENISSGTRMLPEEMGSEQAACVCHSVSVITLIVRPVLASQLDCCFLCAVGTLCVRSSGRQRERWPRNSR